MITDPVLAEECLDKVIDYNWDAEKTHFEETYDVEVDDDLDKWIKECKIKGYTEHVFYSLMVVKSYFQKI